MSKLRNRARSSGAVFSPLVFRQALRLEQVAWSEIQESASEVVFVARSAQRLFRLDATCPNFDTWTEFEATGGTVERDAVGVVAGVVGPPPALLPPKEYARSAVIESAAEVIRRLADDSSTAALPLAAVTFGSTLMQRLHGVARTAAIIDDLRTGKPDRATVDATDYVREVTLEIATKYLEAGAAGLLLLHEENEADVPELPGFAALFNLTAYYDVPAVLMCRRDVNDAGLSAIGKTAAEFYITPAQHSASLSPLVGEDGAERRGQEAWLGLSRWEIEPSRDPDFVHAMRRQLLDA